jgi:hypothetical protein
MLAVGSAPCLYADVGEALRLRPFAEIMLINGACTAIQDAEHVLAGHEEKCEFFAEARRKAFPNAQPWRLHANTQEHRRNEMKHLCPSVTDWWPFEKGIGATSASKAAKIAKHYLGFDEVILCGSPLDDSGYFAGEGKGIPQNRSCLRIGDPGFSSHVTPHHTGQYSTQPGMPMRVQESKLIQSYRTRFRQLAEGEFKGWVYSMSGFTREILGYPPTQRN